MSALQTSIFVIWVIFWLYWLVSAIGAKQGTRSGGGRPVALLILAVAGLVIRRFGWRGLVVHSLFLEILGAVVLVFGLGLAVWARIYLGRNWGMPMTRKDEPELVTSGPYKYVRHPIYSGILLGTVGTGLAVNLSWLVVFVVLGVYFGYSASVEEKLMTDSFPREYPSYRAKSKMLIPFVL